MPEHITQRTLDRLNPEGTGKRYFVRGSNPVGWGIEVSAKGKASYFIETRLTGRRSATRKKIGSVDIISLSDAQAEAKAFLGDAAKGVDICYSAAEEDILTKTVGYALEMHLNKKRHSLRTSTISDLQKTFNNCFSDLRTLPLQQLSKKRVKDRYLELRDTGKTSDYVNKAFRDLSSTLSYYDVEPNPIRVLKQKGLGQARKARETGPIKSCTYNTTPLYRLKTWSQWNKSAKNNQNLSIIYADRSPQRRGAWIALARH